MKEYEMISQIKFRAFQFTDSTESIELLNSVISENLERKSFFSAIQNGSAYKLVLTKYGTNTNVNKGDWIVIGFDDEFYLFSDNAFNERFREI